MFENINFEQDITIIYPPIVDWYLLYQRPHQLLTAFSQLGVRCIFMSSESYRKLLGPVLKINQNLYVIKANVNYDSLIKGKKVLWFSHPSHYIYAEKNRFDFVVFDALDSPKEEFADWKIDLDNAVRVADIISCTSLDLFNNFKSEGKPLFICSNAADYEHFKSAQNKMKRPLDYPIFQRGKKVVGFYGALATWIDEELILKIAERYKVVLIGKNQFYKRYPSHLNISVLDHKEYKDLPQYASQFDVTMIPFKLTEMVKGCDPIKLYEYLCTGKPVVATEIYELKRRFSNLIYFMNKGNCNAVINQSIVENNAQKRQERIETARRNSWSQRAEHALSVINKYMH